MNNKNVLVTGGTHGIGLAIVEELCQLGANVVTCSRNASDAKACEISWKRKGFNTYSLIADVSTDNGRQYLKMEVDRIFGGRLDCLVNNVGYNVTKKTVDYTEEELSHILNTNTQSVFMLNQSMYPLLKRTNTSGGGTSIVNMGSVSGGCNVSLKSGVPYAMSKAALTQMTYNLAVEWAQDGIRVNCVSPYYIHTRRTSPVLSDPVQFQAVVDRTPMHRPGIVYCICC